MEGKENTAGATENVEENEDEGQEAQASNGADENGTSAGNANGGKPGKTFNQEQVNRMMTREKRQGAASVYKELGIDPKDKKAVAMVKALIASQKSDEQLELEQRAENDAKEREAEERVLKAEIKAEAMVLGIKREYVEDMVALVLAKKTEDSDVNTLLGEYKKKYPLWFEDGKGDDGKDDKKTGQRGTGSAIKGDGGKKDKPSGEQGMGQRLAARRKASAPKKSFWS